MRTACGVIASILALINIAAAQSACLSLTSEFPPCAYTCVSSAANAVGCTDPNNLACQCNPQSSGVISASALDCVVNCGGDAVASAIKAGSDICNCVATATQSSSSPPSSSSSQKGSSSAPPTSSSAPPKSSSSGPPISSSSSGRSSSQTTKKSESSQPTSSKTTSKSNSKTSKTTSSCVLPSSSDCGSLTSIIPECGRPCLKSAASALKCDPADYACQCKPIPQTTTSVEMPDFFACFQTACPHDSSSSASATKGIKSLCACATASHSSGTCGPTTSSSPSGPESSSSAPMTSGGGGGGGTVTETAHPTETVTCDSGCTGPPGGPPGGPPESSPGGPPVESEPGNPGGGGQEPTETEGGGGPPVVTAGSASSNVGLAVGIGAAIFAFMVVV